VPANTDTLPLPPSGNTGSHLINDPCNLVPWPREDTEFQATALPW
jgi:hypothetical protein